MSFNQAFAHQTIIGQVLEKDNNSPIWGASVYINGTNIGTTTDELGKFALIADTTVQELTISYIGFETQNFQVNHGKNHSFTLNRSSLKLNEVSVNARGTKTTQKISAVDIALKPVNSSQEILRSVPGLFIGQHAGGGKAEQIFLRGYDIDHGTDLSITVDGMPVNMVSHAHGQGYSDLHFLIPELIEKVDFDKGPYYAENGNFATAGYVDFKTKNSIQKNRVQVEAGSFKTFRVLGMVDLLKPTVSLNKNQDAFLATEFITSQGPFESPQDFQRFNIFYKHSYKLNEKNYLKTQVSHFRSSWNASGQIPESAVENGTISRFGAIDADEGGKTNRTNVTGILNTYLSDKSSLESQAFYTNYNFTLFSNFTFFLEDLENEDRIKQQENRNIFGGNTAYKFTTKNKGVKYISKIGAGIRYDMSDENELAHVLGRDSIIEQYAYGNIDETNFNVFASQDFVVKKFIFNVGARMDFFNFRYLDKLNNNKQLSNNAATINAKFNVLYNINNSYQIYLKGGTGFHSNDTRSAVYATNTKDILPRVFGADLGTNMNIGKRVFVNIAGWTLFQQNELVYVGDAGIVEENGESIRAGIDFSTRIQLLDWLFLEGNLNYTLARSLESDKGENYIPLAPSLTSTGGVYIKHKSGFNSSLTYRNISNRPANEDFSLTAKGYTVLDMSINYTQKKYEIGLVVENLLNTEWREAQFETESRISPEAASTTEIHFTPGAPLSLRGKVAFFF